MRTSVIAALLSLAACQTPAPQSGASATGATSQPAVTPPRQDSAAPATDTSSMPVELTVTAQRYAPGAEITLTLANGSDATWAFNPCMRTVEREANGAWTTLREDRICTMEAWLLEPRQSRTATTELPDQMEPGRYRVIVGLTLESAGTAGARPPERVNATSAPFTVRR